MAEKVETRQQPNRLRKFWRETEGELRKVSWPTFEEAKKLTIIVLVVLFAMAIFLGSMDFLFAQLITRLLA